MASSPSELTLDCKQHTSYSMLLKSFEDHQINDQTQNLEHVLSSLEEERLKIDAFKRELPLCMQLLTNAVEASRKQLDVYRENQGSKPVIEESQNMSDKANWMTTAQLWSQPGHDQTKPQSTTESPKLALDSTKPRYGGAFVPFSKERNSSSCQQPNLALASVTKDMHGQKKCSDTKNGTPDGDITDNGQATNSSQSHRKSRRCWSPDLHRRFINALHILGGSQVATPKQIRELMKVEGLTNDEVKSHLQKYRLHTRRPSPSPQQAGPPTTQLVVLGSIWVPQEYATAAAATHDGTPTLYGAHHHHHPAPQPQYFYGSPVPREFYSATVAATPTPAPPQLLHVYKSTSEDHSSPESNVKGSGDRSVSIEDDDNSESSSWKGESGGDERKGLAALREEGEESNGSEITLKF